MANSFLKPRSVSLPSQGDYQFIPEIVIHESDTAAGLELLLNTGVSVEGADTDNFYVVESIEYQVAVVRPEVGMNPAVMSYSALVHLTRVNII